MDEKKSSKLSKKKKITIFSVLLIFIVLFSIIGFFIYRFYAHSYEGNTEETKVNVVDENINFKEVQGVTNILLLSSDARPGEDTSRSDSIMILTIDNVNKKLKVTSLMRDMLVEIDGYGEEKLNHAFAYGGPTKTIETIQNNFGVKLDNYVIVDFNAFVKVVDAIGGIETTIKDYELDELNKYILDGGGSEEDLLPTPGTYNLNGYQALSYARIRKVGNGEYERTERQRALLQLALEKVKDMSPVKLVSLLNELFPYIKTNISLGNAINYGFTALKVGKDCNFEINQFRIPLDSISKGGIIDDKGWVFVIDKVETAKALQEFIFNDNANYEPDTSNFQNITEEYFNDYNIKDDTSHPDYEYSPNSNNSNNSKEYSPESYDNNQTYDNNENFNTVEENYNNFDSEPEKTPSNNEENKNNETNDSESLDKPSQSGSENSQENSSNSNSSEEAGEISTNNNQ